MVTGIDESFAGLGPIDARGSANADSKAGGRATRGEVKCMSTRSKLAFFVGDCLAGSLTGAATALAVRVVVPAEGEMVMAMLLGMTAGTIVHLVVAVLLSPLLGMFETMVPGMYVGMYGGMLFGMRDAMQRELVSTTTAAWVGAAFGVIVVVGVSFWNAQLRRRVLCTGVEA